MSTDEPVKLLEYIKSDKYLLLMLDAMLSAKDKQAFICDALPYLAELKAQYIQPPVSEPQGED